MLQLYIVADIIGFVPTQYIPKTLKSAANFIGGGHDIKEKKIQFIDVRDLANWIILMIENGAEGIYNANGPDTRMTMEDFINECSKVFDSNKEIVWVTENTLLENKVNPWVELPLWIPTEQEFGLDSKKAIEHGLTFRQVRETLRDTYEWDKERGLIDRKAGLDLKREKEILNKLGYS